MNAIGLCRILKFRSGALSLMGESLTLGKLAMSATKILWGQIAVVVLIILATTWAATQWTAWRLGFQPQLGQPWFQIVPGMPVYLPPAFFWWWYAYDAYAQGSFSKAPQSRIWRPHLRSSRHRHVGMAGAGDYDHRDLRLGPLGDNA